MRAYTHVDSTLSAFPDPRCLCPGGEREALQSQLSVERLQHREVVDRLEARLLRLEQVCALCDMSDVLLSITRVVLPSPSSLFVSFSFSHILTLSCSLAHLPPRYFSVSFSPSFSLYFHSLSTSSNIFPPLALSPSNPILASTPPTVPSSLSLSFTSRRSMTHAGSCDGLRKRAMLQKMRLGLYSAVTLCVSQSTQKCRQPLTSSP